ncbi:ATPase [Dictyobacter sp. S3.2.2.5]|uniref:ATPase n=1 Tax=Dictyobacter halimunensis TaxID=3026934 RepID=A0ABQ6FUC6_9CHLR|nr:ATPase [Dictyobacter sp. S3.2.2.5]
MPTSETPHQPRVRLTEARVSYNLSQQEVADEIGTTYVNVSRWERGITRPNPYFRRKLCALFNKTEEELDLLTARTERGKSGRSSSSGASSAPATVAAPVVQRVIYDPAIPLLPAIPLVGREKDLAVIRQRLKGSGNMALTALNGLPGVGKTALSVALAHDGELREFFKDGILWAGLGPQPNLPGIFSRWGNLLGISFAEMTKLGSDEARAKAIRNAIGDRAMLIIIDDAWKLEEALAFRVGGSHCAHLVTTRFPNIASHMALGNAINIRELGESESISLLNLLAPQVIYREQQKVHDLVQAVGGLPLALTLIGNYLRKQAYSGPARRITSALERLSNAEVRLKLKEPHIPAESHPSLPNEQSLSIQSIIAVTDQLLDEETRRALYALSVFPPKPNTFSEEAAMAVAACGTDELDALSDAGMLESNGERYLLHQVISDYALLQISDEQLTAAQEHLVAYYADYVEEHKKDYEQLEEDSSTIEATLEIAYEIDESIAFIRGVCAFAPFLLLRGLYVQAEHYLEQAYEKVVDQNDQTRHAQVLLYLGETAQKRGESQKAEQYLLRGLEIARSNADNERICALLGNLGDIKWRSGDLKQAEDYLTEGLALAQQIGDIERMSNLLKSLGPVVTNQGNYQKATEYLEQGLALSRQINNHEQACLLLSNLGVLAGMMGKYEPAEMYFQEGLLLARQLGHREQICILLLNLGAVSVDKKNYMQAKAYFQEGLAISRQMGYPEGTSMLLLNLGEIAVIEKNHIQAEKYLQETLALAKQLGRPLIIARTMLEYGKLHLQQAELESAEKDFCEVLTTASKGNLDLIAMANYGLAQVAARQNDLVRATSLGKESLAILETMGDPNSKEVGEWLQSLHN